RRRSGWAARRSPAATSWPPSWSGSCASRAGASSASSGPARYGASDFGQRRQVTMKVDGGIPTNLAQVAAAAKEVEAAGYSGGWTAETSHEPFLPHVLAAEHTEKLELGTSIAVAFARNPMTLANTAWDLQAYSKGRFILGLGSQIKPHITKRFSMEWSH